MARVRTPTILAILALAGCDGPTAVARLEIKTIGNLKALNKAEWQFQAKMHRFAMFEELGPKQAGLIERDLASGTTNGYHFTIDAKTDEYAIHASPVKFGLDGRRTFFSNQTGTIRQKWSSEPADENSPQYDAIWAKVSIPIIFAILALAGCRRTGDLEIAAINNLRALHAAESQLHAKERRFGTLQELGRTKLIEANLANGLTDGYRFTVDADRDSYVIQASPLQFRVGTRRSFFTNQTQVTCQSWTAEPATENSPELVAIKRVSP